MGIIISTIIIIVIRISSGKPQPNIIEERNACHIHYDVWGESNEAALVFLHSHKTNSLIWFPQVAYFASRYKVITIDLRGYGKSPCINPTENDLKPQHFVTDLIEILDREKVNKAILICNAFGGWTGLSTTLQFPSRIKALILAGSPASIQTESIKREYAEGSEKNKTYVSIDEQFKGQEESQWIEYLNDMELAPGFSTRNKQNALLYRQIARNNLNIPKRIYPNGTLVGTSFTPEEASQVTVQTLMIAGDEDQWFSVQTLQEIANILKAEMVVMKGVGHTMAYEDPEQFNNIIDTYLTKLNQLKLND